MAYGAYIDVNGNPFITPNSTPMALYRKVTVQSSSSRNFNSATASVNIPGGSSLIAFGRTSGYAALSSSISWQTISLSASNYNVTPFTLEAYFFAIFPQTLPAWGMAIWDESGKLILTNETRVMTDLVTIGTPGASTGGVFIDQTFPGQKLAVAPAILGAVLLQGPPQQGQPTIQPVTAYTACHNDGNGTRFRSATSSSASGGSMGTSNLGNIMQAIEVSKYD